MSKQMSSHEKKQVLDIIWSRRTQLGDLMPTVLSHNDQCMFFDYYNNHYDGWFVTVRYANGESELWLAVYGIDDDDTGDWHVEQIFTNGGPVKP